LSEGAFLSRRTAGVALTSRERDGSKLITSASALKRKPGAGWKRIEKAGRCW
jgi:hypothetical protein